jgi:hypothetical protein
MRKYYSVFTGARQNARVPKMWCLYVFYLPPLIVNSFITDACQRLQIIGRLYKPQEGALQYLNFPTNSQSGLLGTFSAIWDTNQRGKEKCINEKLLWIQIAIAAAAARLGNQGT